jgi:hypothetical protein
VVTSVRASLKNPTGVGLTVRNSQRERIYEFALVCQALSLCTHEAKRVERIASVLVDEWSNAGYEDPFL